MTAPPGHNPANKSAEDEAKSAHDAPNPKDPRSPNPVWQSLALGSDIVQTQLTVGMADDPYEREADAVADQVMSMPAPPSDGHGPSITPVAAYQAQRDCAECEEEEGGALQRKERGSAAEAPAVVPSSAHDVLGSYGQPLDAATRAYFEPRFGRDFSGVRIHTGGDANTATHDARARAFTVANRIAFAAGQYEPRSEAGRRLLAHELTHVAQQETIEQNSGRMLLQREPTDVPSAPEESEKAHIDIERVVLEQSKFLLDHVLPAVMVQYTLEEIARTTKDKEGNVESEYEFGNLVYRRASNDTYAGNHCTDLVFNAAWLAGYRLPTQKDLFPKKQGLLPTHEIFVNLEKLEGLGLIEVVVQPNNRFRGSAPQQVRAVRPGDVMLWDRELQKPEPPYAWLGHTAVIEKIHHGKTPYGEGLYPMMSTGEHKTPIPGYHFQQDELGSETRSQIPAELPTLNVIEAGSHVGPAERELWPSDRYSAVYRFAQLDGERIVKMYREDPVYRSRFNDAWSASAGENPITPELP